MRTKGLFILDFLHTIIIKSPTTLRVVGAGFTRSNRLYEGIRFVLVATKSEFITNIGSEATESYVSPP